MCVRAPSKREGRRSHPACCKVMCLVQQRFPSKPRSDWAGVAFAFQKRAWGGKGVDTVIGEVWPLCYVVELEVMFAKWKKRRRKRQNADGDSFGMGRYDQTVQTSASDTRFLKTGA